MSSPQAQRPARPDTKATPDPRVERSSLIIGRLARAFGSTLQKKGWTGAHTTRDYVHAGKTYERLYFQWPHETDYARHEYEVLNGAIREYVDGRAEEDRVKTAWTAYAQACLHPPEFKPQRRAPAPEFPPTPVPASLEAEMPAEPSERHALLFKERGSHGQELVIFDGRDHTNALELMRWINKGYTHIKVRSQGEWVRLRFPRSQDIRLAREERGEKKTKKKYSDGADEDHVEAPKPAMDFGVPQGHTTLDQLREIKERMQAAKKKKGRKK